MRTIHLLAFGCIFCLSAPAWADIVMPPPKKCPLGTRGISSHRGPSCVPARCKSDKDCKSLKGTTCQQASTCIQKHTAYYGGRIVYVNPKLKGKTYNYYTGHGPCTAAGKCKKGKCQKAKICLPKLVLKSAPKKAQKAPSKRAKPKKSAPSKPRKRSNCDTLGTRPSTAALYLLLCLLFVLTIRRKLPRA